MKNIFNTLCDSWKYVSYVFMFCCISVSLSAQTFTGPGGPIPSGAPGATSGTDSYDLTVSGLDAACAPQGLVVCINNLSHTFPGDLIFELASPSGSMELIFGQGGGTDVVGQTLCFDDAATGTWIPGTGGTFTVAPSDPATSLQDLIGLVGGSWNGTWTLTVTDRFGGDVGSFDSWSLAFGASDPNCCQLFGCDDFVLDNTPGLCEAIFTPPPVTSNCVILERPTQVVQQCGAAAALAGQTQAFTITGPFPTPGPCVTDATVTICVTADMNGAGFELATVTAEGFTIGTFDGTAGDCAESCEDFTIPLAVYNALIADGTINLSATFDANVNVGLCATNEVSGCVSVPTACEPLEIVVTLPDGSTQSTLPASYPIGTTCIEYVATGSGSGMSMEIGCKSTITVNDTEPPMLECPGDFTFNLQSGECTVVYNYDVVATDNCGFQTPDMDIDGTFGSLANCPGAGSTLSCGAGQTSQIQEIDISALPDEFVLTDGCFVFDNTAWGQTMATVNFYCAPAGLTAAGAPLPCATTGETVVATSGLVDLAALGAAPGEAVCIPVFVPDAAGNPTMDQLIVDNAMCGSLYMEVFTVGGALSWNGPSCNGIVSDGTNTYLCSPGCGDGYFADFGFTAIDAFMAIQGATINEVEPTDPNVAASGSDLPIGQHTFTYSVADGLGNVASCEWTVTVNGVPQDQIAQSLACNDHVNISVDENCMIFISADQFLEGGPYSCYYECYQVFITDEFGNPVVSGCGPDAALYPGGDPFGANANGDDLNGCYVDLPCGNYTYMVTDACNDNTCWGTLLVEDKIGPVIEAVADVTVLCDESSAPGRTGTPAVVEGCGDERIVSSDEILSDDDCGELRIARTWVAIDAKGNESNRVTQIVVVDRAGSTTTPEGPMNVEVSCGACTDPQCLYDFYYAEFRANNPWAESWIVDPEWYQDDIAVWTANAVSYASMRAMVFITVDGFKRPLTNDNHCNLFVDYTDHEIDVCGDHCSGGNKKIVRTWTVLDWCDPTNNATFTQIISAKDAEGPSFDLPANFVVGAAPWECKASFNMPEPFHISDNCSEVDEMTWRVYGAPGTVTGESASPYFDDSRGVWRVQGLPKDGSPHTYIYEMTDCCGNVTNVNFVVTVVDQSAPIATATQNIVVNLTSAPTDPNGGVAKVYKESIDNGSNDGDCGPVRIAIRRIDSDDDGDIDGYCGNFGEDVIINDDREPHNNNSTFYNWNNVRDADQPTDHDQDDTDGGQFVKFCCQDIIEYGVDEDGDGVNDYALIDVELGVWDDANMDGVPGSLPNDMGADLFSRTWATVRVEAKINPSITCPPDVTLACDMDETNFDLTGFAYASSTCGDLPVTHMDLCGRDVNGDMVIQDYVIPGATTEDPGTLVQEDVFNKACHYGPIMRYWSIEGTGVKCLQRIILEEPTTNFDGDNHIDWPYSRNRYIEIVNNDGFANDCDGDGNPREVPVSDIFLTPATGTPDYAEIRLSCAQAFCEEPVWVDASCSLVGWSLESDTFYFEGDACRKIINTYTVIDWCQYDPNSVDGEGIWTWTVIGKLIDPYAPIVDAPDAMFPAGAGGSGSASPTDGPCVGTAAMCATATDSAIDEDGNVITDACPSEWLKWVVLLDLNNDWTYEREWSSFVAPDLGTRNDPYWSEDNAADNLALYGQLIPDVRVGNDAGFDNNGSDFATAPGFKYQINIPDVIAADCGQTQHRVVWKVYDGCGNVTSTTSYFTVQDKKAPTPYCINLSTALMQDPDGDGPAEAMVELWAIDFDAGSFDNCTTYESLRYTFGPVAPENDPDYNADSRSSAMVFTCADLNGTNSAVLTRNVYVWDECGNYDFCTVNLRVIGTCDGDDTGTGSIAGTVMTEFGETVENVSVDNYDMMYQASIDDMTNDGGKYAFSDNLFGNDFVVSADKDDDYLNGVSTLDLVIMQKHILGVQSLDSPYKMIAADINKDGSITAIDLIELRKLILGIYDELPNNSSWRFADASKTIDIANPWNFDETIDIAALRADMMEEDFVGIKVGDVNQSVVANLSSTSTETRSSRSIAVNYDDRAVEAGETVTLEVNATDLSNVYGYQFTLDVTGLEMTNVESGIVNVTDANFGSFDNVITTSWNSVTPVDAIGTLFTMEFKAQKAGMLSDILDINSKVTRAEAYVGENLDIVDVELRSGDKADNVYALYQNEPNPFTENTVVGFNLPEAGSATLSILDVTGKVIRSITEDYPQGYNEVKLSKSDFGATGVLYYQLESGDFTATKKMIIIE